MAEEFKIIRQPQTGRPINRVEFAPDTFPPALVSIRVTLQVTPGDVTRMEIPEGACGFRLFSESGDIRFAIDKDPESIAVSGNAEITVDEYAEGNTSEQDFFEVRTFEDIAKTLRLTGVVGSEIVRVEFF